MTSIESRHPRTRQEGLSALSLRRGTGVQREVSWHHIKYRNRSGSLLDHYPVNVSDDNTLLIRVWSGIPKLIVESGHATIEFWSSWGNSLTVRPGASAHVITDEHTKVTVENEGTLTVDAPAKNRVAVFNRGDGQVSGVEPIKPLELA